MVLQEMVTHAQLEGLDSGTPDVGLVRALPPGARHASRPLAPEALLVALQQDDPLCSHHELGPADPEGRGLIGYSPDAPRYFFEPTSGVLDRAGVRPNVVQQVGQIHTMLALVGMVSGLFFGFAFGIGGISAAGVGWMADRQGLDFVFLLCSFLPAIGILTAFLPIRLEDAARTSVEFFPSTSTSCLARRCWTSTAV